MIIQDDLVRFRSILPKQIKLSTVSVSTVSIPEVEKERTEQSGPGDSTVPPASCKTAKIFPRDPPEEHIHIFVKAPQAAHHEELHPTRSAFTA